MSIVLTVFISFFLGCCGGVSSPAPMPNSKSIAAAPVLAMISLSPATAAIHVGGDQTFIAQGLDQYHNPMTGITFTWTSSDDGANGHAIARFHGGVATGVSAGIMHVTASASVVTSAPAALTVLAPTSSAKARGNAAGTYQSAHLSRPYIQSTLCEIFRRKSIVGNPLPAIEQLRS
jgi:hypothetical protein